MNISFFKKSNCLFSFIIMLVASLAISCSGNDEFDAQPEDPQTRATFDSDAFVTEWLVPEDSIVTLPLDATYQYSCIIDWGDDTPLTYISSSADYKRAWHRYLETGSYQIKILGVFPRWNWKTDLPCKQYLTQIVQWGNVSLQEVYAAFGGCKNLVSIAAGIPDMPSYSYMFSGCTGLTSLPEGLFSNSVTAKSFTGVFAECTGLKSLPPNLFENCVSAESFMLIFRSAGLVSLPAGLFRNCSRVNTFVYTFWNCKDLKTIPADLFSSCPEVTTFSNTFWMCSSLTSIPTTLFANCKKVTSFNRTFKDCFALTGKTPVSDGFELWNRAGQIGYPDVINGSGCFSGCTNLYISQNGINATWK